MQENKQRRFSHLIGWSFLFLSLGIMLNLIMPPTLLSLGSIGKALWFEQVNNWLYKKGLLIPFCAFYIAFNFAVFFGVKCQSKKEKNLVWWSFIVGMIISELAGIVIFLNSPHWGMVGEILGQLFVGALFVAVGLLPKGLCIGVVKLGLSQSSHQNSKNKLTPYITSFILLIVALSLNFYVLTSLANSKHKLNVTDQQNQVDSTAIVRDKFQNNENMFKHWTIRSDSVREYLYRIYHKRGYYVELVKEVDKFGDPICLRRKVFNQANKLTSEDTITIAKIIPNPPIPAGGITSLVTVSYLLKYSRNEFTYDELVKWCSCVILSGLLVKEDARNIMFVITQISIADKPEFRLTEDGLNELIGRLAVVARHSS